MDISSNSVVNHYKWRDTLEEKNQWIKEILDSTTSHLLKLIDHDLALIYLNEEERYQLVYTHPHHIIQEIDSLHLSADFLKMIEDNKEGIISGRNDDLSAILKIRQPIKSYSYILLPLKLNSKLLGLIIFAKFQIKGIDKLNTPLLLFFSHQLSNILENINIFRREQKKSALVAQINSICQNIDSIMNIDELYNKVVDVIQRSFGYEHVALYLVDRKTNTICLKSISGIYKNITPSNQTLQLGQGIVGWVVQTGNTILSNDTTQDPHFYNITPDKTPTQSELCVPIKIENEIIGALNIESREIMDFDDDDINSIEVLANRVGVAIHNSKLYQKVQDNSQRLYDIVSSMGQGVITMGRDFKIQWANKTFSDWGWTIPDILDKHCYELFNNERIRCQGCPARKTFKSGKISRKMIQTKNGKYYVVTSAPIKDGSGTVNQILEVFDDVTQNIKNQTELKETRTQLEHSKYLAAIGELTATIAHEIRNPLNAISNAIDILQSELTLDGDCTKLINVVKEESTRVNDIISHYLKFARVPKLHLTLNNIQNAIEETITLLKVDKNISKEIELITYFKNVPTQLEFDRNAIKQVFWNLIMNSVEAISTKGIIEVRANKKDNYLEIKIRDNGDGIAPNHLKKIFEPFYSLKSEGTGLGLAIVRRIIERHNWTIDVESELGKGTTFTIKIPL